jgi:hypothetical protein
MAVGSSFATIVIRDVEQPGGMKVAHFILKPLSEADTIAVEDELGIGRFDLRGVSRHEAERFHMPLRQKQETKGYRMTTIFWPFPPGMKPDGRHFPEGEPSNANAPHQDGD